MGGGQSLPADQHVVVVGAGYGGAQLGLLLKKAKANYTIIDARDVMHHNVAAVRAVVEPGFARKTLIPLKETFGEHFKQGKVTSIDAANKKVVLDGGEEISYDVLVLCTGSSGPFPGKYSIDSSKDEALAQFEKMFERVKSSSKVAIIGGGAAGVELAAEIATDYPEKEVTIIHSGEELVMPNLAKKFQDRMNHILDMLKIKRILGERVENVADIPEDGGPVTLTTDKGQAVEVDFAIMFTGLSVNTAAYSSLGDAMDERGCLKTNQYLQVEGHEDIFAIGDCNHLDKKMAYVAGDQANIAIENIARKFKGQTMKPYKAGSGMLLVALSLGRNHGMGHRQNGGLLPEFIIKTLKSKDLMVAKFWKNMGQPVPK